MKTQILNTYLQYGVPSDIAEKLAGNNLPLTTFRQTSKTNLSANYGLSDEIIDLVKDLITRSPIDDEVVFRLLSNSNYVCNVCKGKKGLSYIIHHIDEYSLTQNNSYENLIVLCPTCHDLAHRENGLTNRLDKDHLSKLKFLWEREVSNYNISKLSMTGNIYDADYINIPRLSELAYELYGGIPETEHSEYLQQQLFINTDNSLNERILVGSHRSYPFDFGNSYRIRNHFTSIFKQILNTISFTDLEESLTKKTVLNASFIGQYCFYVGGLYGNSPKLPVNETTPVCHLYFRRKYFYVEWKIDPKYVMSSTAICRLSEHSIYIIYGRVKSVGEKIIKGKKFIHIDIRPYFAGTPNDMKDRTPIVKYIKENEYCEDDYDEIYNDEIET